jgi:hypothetical protein
VGKWFLGGGGIGLELGDVVCGAGGEFAGDFFEGVDGGDFFGGGLGGFELGGGFLVGFKLIDEGSGEGFEIGDPGVTTGGVGGEELFEEIDGVFWASELPIFDGGEEREDGLIVGGVKGGDGGRGDGGVSAGEFGDFEEEGGEWEFDGVGGGGGESEDAIEGIVGENSVTGGGF